MKKSVSFSRKETENKRLSFSELRDKGLARVQELSGAVWTDYNSHDPGVTILEQLCYALTDIVYRTSFPIEDLLTTDEELKRESFKNNNAFFSSSDIFSSHPITLMDTKKIIIDRFDEVENVWITTTKNEGCEEQLNGINQIAILPKLHFHNSLRYNTNKKEEILNKIRDFLNKNRNLGEDFENVCLLDKQDFKIDFEIHIDEQIDANIIIARLFLALSEFIYCHVHYYSLDDMKETGLSMAEIFAGPKLEKGFIKNKELKKRVKRIYVDELQKLFTKVKGVHRCVINELFIQGEDKGKENVIVVDSDKFFHITLKGFCENIKVFVNKDRIAYNTERIYRLYRETYSKKHREYPVDSDLKYKKKGSYRKPDKYYSIQNHFPILYGIGREGISQKEPKERHAKALQLKAYLMFFEQHLANHLAQLGNMNTFFNIDYENGIKQTYFSQRMSSIPGIEKLENKNNIAQVQSILENKHTFFNRKNRIFDHLLARFGEDLNDFPWRLSLEINLIKTEDEFNQILLQKKSEFLQQLEQLNYVRIKGESLVYENNKELTRIPSGLEQIIMAKTGILSRGSKSLVPDFSRFNPHEIDKKPGDKSKEGTFDDKDFRTLSDDEISSYKIDSKENIPKIMFEEIDFKTLFKDTLDYKNYKISRSKGANGKIEVIFHKEGAPKVNLLACESAEEAVQNVHQIVAYFIKQNEVSEGLYIVDHILLRSFLKDSSYGFSFKDEEGKDLFQTIHEESWCNTEQERKDRVKEFYEAGLDRSSYFFGNEDCKIKDQDGRIIASYKGNAHNLKNFNDEVYKQTKSIIQLFSSSEQENGRLLIKELEEIRLHGNDEYSNKKIRQRRLIFQRKLSDRGTIVDEDFFNLDISIFLPDWPARFQDERFKAYITDLIRERTPSHISNKIVWVNKAEMKAFEELYYFWGKQKLKSRNSETPSKDMISAAYEVYLKIMEIRVSQKIKE